MVRRRASRIGSLLAAFAATAPALGGGGGSRTRIRPGGRYDQFVCRSGRGAPTRLLITPRKSAKPFHWCSTTELSVHDGPSRIRTYDLPVISRTCVCFARRGAG